jgi:hypothetical protein
MSWARGLDVYMKWTFQQRNLGSAKVWDVEKLRGQEHVWHISLSPRFVYWSTYFCTMLLLIGLSFRPRCGSDAWTKGPR